MAVGTFFTLFVVPSIYMLVARDRAKDRQARADEVNPPSSSAD
jgi:hypothetical protein